MNLLVVIVNYRTAGLVIDCLRSLESDVSYLKQTRVVVTDCASGDDSIAQIEQAIEVNAWHPWVTLQPLDRNGGFAYGNNAAIRPALRSDSPPRYVLLLNPDTIVRSGALKTLVDFMEDSPEVGIAGSRLEDPDGTPQRSAFRFPSILGELESGLRLGLATRFLSRWVVAPPVPREACRTDWVSGASMMICRDVFQSIGLLDEKYFMYYEEVDFCRRAQQADWLCWYVPSARVVHLEGATAGVRGCRASHARRPPFWFDSRRRYFRSHLGYIGARLADIAWALGFASFRVRQVLQRKPNDDPPHFLRDFLSHNFLPSSRSFP